MLVTFCGKLECSFLTATISVDTRRRFNVYKIFTQTSYRRWNDVVCLLGCYFCIFIFQQPQRFQSLKSDKLRKLWLTNFLTNRYTIGNKKFMTFRFSSVLIRFLTFLFIFVSLGLQTTHLSYDKNDVTNILSCDITPIFFSVRTYTKLEISLPPPTSLALIPYRK